jgi:hypothetical protein
MLRKLLRFSQQLKRYLLDSSAPLFSNNPDTLVCSKVFHARALFSGKGYGVKEACINTGPASSALVIQNRGFAFKSYGSKRTDFYALLTGNAVFCD